MKSSFFTISLMAVCIVASPLLAQKGGNSPQNHRKKNYTEMICEKLNLSEEQKEKIEKLHEERSVKRKEHFTEVKQIKDQIKEELLKEKPDKSVLYGYEEKMSEMQIKNGKERIDHLLEMKKILDKEQFSNLLDRHKNKMHHKNWKKSPKAYK